MNTYRVHGPTGTVRVQSENKDWAFKVGVTLLHCRYPEDLKEFKEEDFVIEEEIVEEGEVTYA